MVHTHTYTHTHSHESQVKHVVIESKRDPVAGIVYNITPNGPFFNTLYDLIEEGKKSAIIQNHMFDVTLGKCPPKVHFVMSACAVPYCQRANNDTMVGGQSSTMFIYHLWLVLGQIPRDDHGFVPVHIFGYLLRPLSNNFCNLSLIV